MTAAPALAPRPDSTDAAPTRDEFERWLAQLCLDDIAGAHAGLSSRIASINQSVIPAVQRLELVGLLHAPVVNVQASVVPIYLAVPLPFNPVIESAWSDVVALWLHLATGYELCVRSWVSGEAGLEEAMPSAMQAAISGIAAAMLEHARAYRTVNPELWRRLHRLYALAEARGMAAVAAPGGTGSCMSAYARAMLCHAAQPASLAPHEIEVLEQWAGNWADRVPVVPAMPDPGFAPRIGVSLSSNSGPAASRNLPLLPTSRVLDTRALAHAIASAVQSLDEGAAPMQCGLGSSLDTFGTLTLLQHLEHQWCGTGPAPRDRRRDSGRIATVLPTIGAVHARLSGTESRPPALTGEGNAEQSWPASVDPVEDAALPPGARHAPDAGTWIVVNESGSGALLRCARPTANTAIAHGQLLAVTDSAGNSMLLGRVGRLRMEFNGALTAGLRTYCGRWSAAATREIGAAAAWEPALLLGEADPDGTEPTLVIAPRALEPGDVLELYRDAPCLARIEQCLEHGANFERYRWTPVEVPPPAG